MAARNDSGAPAAAEKTAAASEALRDDIDWTAIEEKLAASLVKKRYAHTLGVTYTACALAMCHGADLTRARLAGLLHDAAKCLPDAEKVALCQCSGVAITEVELAHPGLLHAKAGAILADSEYGIRDPEVLDAITWHTTGRQGMTLLEKIVYVADYIEPHRHKAPNLDIVRPLAFADLDACVCRILEDTVAHLAGVHDKATDPMTASALEYYRTLLSERERED